MTYIDGFVLAVPTANKEAYRKMASDASRVFVRHGSRKRPGTESEDARWFESPEAPTGITTAGAQLELGM
jgi:uncharacterized protein YbaA (DUF1428 family)